jgi:hypothetical protein
MTPPLPAHTTTADHAGAPDPKPANGVKIVIAVACAGLLLLALGVWAIVRTFG